MSSTTTSDTMVTQITVPTPFAVGPVNMYLLQRKGYVVLVDAGVNTDEAWNKLLTELDAIGVTVKSLDAIVLTHHHEDHAGLINRILRIRPIPVYVHPRAIPRLTRNPEYLEHRLEFFGKLYQSMGFGERAQRHIQFLRNSMYSPDKLIISESLLLPVHNLSISELPDIQMYYTPGHAVDHVILHDAKENLLFSGDVLLPKISSNAFVEPDERTWKRMNTVSQLYNSMELCAQLNAARVFPGHGNEFYDHEKLVSYRLNRIRQKARRVMDILVGESMTPVKICEKMYSTKVDTEFAPVASEVVGLLDYLEESGCVKVEATPVGDKYFMPMPQDVDVLP